VLRTRVGYAGGTLTDPTYDDLGDHSETTEIDYDPARLSFEDLLGVFWQEHSPRRRAFSRQYRSAIFPNDERQRDAAEASKVDMERRLGVTLFTDIEPAGPLYLAESYHQKYYLRNDRLLMAEFRAMYPREADFVRSTAAARVNAFVGGYGDPGLLESEIARYGLSKEAQATLLDSAARWGNRFRCRA
jgi:peptide-methionine (S)-S-oxide reductase